MNSAKRKILDFFKDVELDEGPHTYNVSPHLKVKIKCSVSGLIKDFVKPFNREGISIGVARKRGISQREVLIEWDKAKDIACATGNEAHLFGELYPFNRDILPKNGYEVAITRFWQHLPEFVVPVVMELQMWHKDFHYAGTADILLYNTETKKFIIADYKTNKDLFKNFKGKKMLGPFCNLLDTPFNKYQLQLSFYQILFEQTGLEVSSRKIVWVKPDGNYEMYNTEDYTLILKQHLKTSYAN